MYRAICQTIHPVQHCFSTGKNRDGCLFPFGLLGINGFYTLGLDLSKIISLRGYYKKEEYRAYFYTEIIILVSALLYMLYCVKLLTDGQNNIQYTKIVAIAIATVTFTEIGIVFMASSRRGEVKSRLSRRLN
jgi:hypothetical protein